MGETDEFHEQSSFGEWNLDSSVDPLSLPYPRKKGKKEEVIQLPYVNQTTIKNFKEPPRPYKSKKPKVKYPRKWGPYHLGMQNERPLALQLLL